MLFNFIAKNQPRQGFNLPVHILNKGITWFIYLTIKVIDISMVWEIIDFVSRVLKPNARMLNPTEHSTIRSIFPSHFTHYFVRINSRSVLAYIGRRYTRKPRLGVSTFHSINFTENPHNTLKDQKWLLHEMVHVKQYQAIGSCYILEALIAQHGEGYNYAVDTEKSLHQYNLEQQAELLSDLVFDDAKVPEEWKKSIFQNARDGRF